MHHNTANSPNPRALAPASICAPVFLFCDLEDSEQIIAVFEAFQRESRDDRVGTEVLLLLLMMIHRFMPVSLSECREWSGIMSLGEECVQCCRQRHAFH